jgi:hypothetical protein
VVLEKDAENQLQKYYIDSRRKGTSYIQYNEGRLTGFATYCVTNIYLSTLLKEK